MADNLAIMEDNDELSLQGGALRSVAFVANDLSYFVHHRSHLIWAVSSAGADVIVLAGGEIPSSPLPFRFRYTRIERFSLHWSDFFLFVKILHLLVFRRPDAIHFISLKPYLYGGLAAQVARLLGWNGQMVVTVPGLGRLFCTQNGRERKNRVTRNIVQWLLRRAMKGAVVTFETASDQQFWVSRQLVAAEATIVTNGAGIDFSLFPARKVEPAEGALTVLYAGRLLRSKGLDVVLAAAELNRSEKIRIWVAGYQEADPDALSIEELSNHPNISFLGGVADMGTLLAEVDAVVLPSRYNEGIPRILIEAAACGCVPIATRFPGSLALIVDEETGFFLQSADTSDQAEELSRLLQELSDDRVRLRKIGTQASQFVRSNGFSSDEIAGTFCKLYKQGRAVVLSGAA